jgi:hypothetical protein
MMERMMAERANAGTRSAPSAVALAVGCAIAIAPADSASADERFGAYDVHTLFAIDKNTDRNQVQYGIRLDRDCVPRGSEPVYAYWRQFERGADVTDDLNFLDRTVYGIKDQHVAAQPGGITRVVIRLRATSDRAIGVYVRKENGACVGDAVTYIGGISARLRLVHVELAGPFSVSWIELRGAKTDGGQPIVERVKP